MSLMLALSHSLPPVKSWLVSMFTRSHPSFQSPVRSRFRYVTPYSAWSWFTPPLLYLPQYE